MNYSISYAISLFKSRYLTYLTAAFLLIPTISIAEAKDQVEVFKGIAKDKEGKVVYIEEHETKIQDGSTVSIITKYLEPKKSEPFAIMKSDFSKNRLVPEMIFEDFRNNYKVESKLSNGKVELYKNYKRRGRTTTKNESFEISDKLMMSQGYHNFIVSQMEKFKPGEEIKIEFLAANRLEKYDFNVRLTSSNADTLNFELEIDSWLIGMFAPKLKVSYDRKTKRILSFEGITNILASNGDAQDLKIEYSY